MKTSNKKQNQATRRRRVNLHVYSDVQFENEHWRIIWAQSKLINTHLARIEWLLWNLSGPPAVIMHIIDTFTFFFFILSWIHLIFVFYFFLNSFSVISFTSKLWIFLTVHFKIFLSVMNIFLNAGPIYVRAARLSIPYWEFT